MSTHRAVTLASRPEGWPEASNFALKQIETLAPADGELLVEIIYLSVDPYMRGRMRDAKSYAAPIELGAVMTGGAVARVVESKSPEYQAGDIVVGDLGWQEKAVVPAKAVRPVDSSIAPISTALSVLGMTGLTAYFGLLDICDPKPSETVVVSGAAGAVGMIVGQIARLKGCRVVGIAGSDEKCDYLVDELGFHAAFNYKTVDHYRKKLAELCPNGIDCYFDNVGGPITDAVFMLLADRARISICGQISQYNNTKVEQGPRQLAQLIVHRAKVEGFLVFDYAERFPEGLNELAAWLRDGKIRYRENVVDGLENAPDAFIGMMQGDNIGKQLVRVKPE